MGSLIRRARGRYDLRETISTRAGPRSRTLVTFRPPLTPEVLARAAARAERPFDRDAILARAAALGVPVSERRQNRAARELLAELRRGEPLDPTLAALLREALDALPAAAPPARFADVAEWVGATAEERGAAVRDLVRVADRIVQSRETRRTRRAAAYPRFSSRTAHPRVRAARAR